MELPTALRHAVDAALRDVPPAALARASAALSSRYRAEVRDGRLHLSDQLAAQAYLATRLPATYAAIRASFAAVAEARPDFSPASLLDVGAGPGSALWAAADAWEGLSSALLLEGAPAIRAYGEPFGEAAGVPEVRWQAADMLRLPKDLAPRDLVVLAYVLDEIAPASRAGLVARLWSLTADLLVIVEPGTPAGHARILAARDALIAAGAHILAPCPHAQACPVAPPGWCHFARRVARTRVHRQAKSADVPWEDEKYIFVAASRHPSLPVQGRVIGTPRVASGQVTLRLCGADGTLADTALSRRDGAAYRAARRLDWGDVLPEETPSGA